MPNELLQINLEASRKSLAAGNTPQLLYLLVNVEPAEKDELCRTPLNLSLVIDRSTSMRGSRLANVRAAATMIVEKLAPDDSLSVIAFSDRATVIVPTGQLQDKAHLLNKIERIRASGGTEVFQGLNAGYRELRRVPLDSHTNHLILLTDGHTYGDSEDCLAAVRNGAQDGITLSAFGLGQEWNQRFLDQLAAVSGGETAYIAAADHVVQALERRIKGLGAVYARNLRLTNDFANPLKLVSAFRVAPSAQPLGIKDHVLRLGNVEGRVPLSFLLELTVEPQAEGTRLPLDIELTADIPSESARDYQIRARLELSVVDGEPEGEPPETLVAAVQAWNFHQMNDNVWNDIEQGNVGRARTRMGQLTKRLMEAGHTKVAQQLLAETERVSTDIGVSEAGRKALTFATRSLVTQTVRLRAIDDETLS